MTANVNYRLIVMPENDQSKLILKEFVKEFIDKPFLSFLIEIDNDLIYLCYEIESDFITRLNLIPFLKERNINEFLIYTTSYNLKKKKLTESILKDGLILNENFEHYVKDKPNIIKYSWYTNVTDKFIELLIKN